MRQKDKYAWKLVDALQKISKNKELLNAFLIDLLTPGEYRELGARWQIIQQLDKGVPQRQIAKNLNVSIATITRGSRELIDEKGGFRQVLQKIAKKK